MCATRDPAHPAAFVHPGVTRLFSRLSARDVESIFPSATAGHSRSSRHGCSRYTLGGPRNARRNAMHPDNRGQETMGLVVVAIIQQMAQAFGIDLDIGQWSLMSHVRDLEPLHG